MPGTLIGTLNFDFNTPAIKAWPGVTFPVGESRNFYVQLVPLSTIVDYGYFIITCGAIIDGDAVEYSPVFKFYPKGFWFGFVGTIPPTTSVVSNFLVGFKEIPIFKGRAQPTTGQISLFWEP